MSGGVKFRNMMPLAAVLRRWNRNAQKGERKNTKKGDKNTIKTSWPAEIRGNNRVSRVRMAKNVEK